MSQLHLKLGKTVKGSNGDELKAEDMEVDMIKRLLEWIRARTGVRAMKKKDRKWIQRPFQKIYGVCTYHWI